MATLGYRGNVVLCRAMSRERLAALLSRLAGDADLRARLIGAPDLEAAVAIAQEAGFDVDKQDWLALQANQLTGLSDGDLEGISGGKGGNGGQDSNDEMWGF